jgi:hypothetical protein
MPYGADGNWLLFPQPKLRATASRVQVAKTSGRYSRTQKCVRASKQGTDRADNGSLTDDNGTLSYVNSILTIRHRCGTDGLRAYVRARGVGMARTWCFLGSTLIYAHCSLGQQVRSRSSSASLMPTARRSRPKLAGQAQGGFTTSRGMQVSSDATIPTIAQGALHTRRYDVALEGAAPLGRAGRDSGARPVL